MAISNGAHISDTRSGFLEAAKRLFAERGFYGASLANIAEELGLTKQALIHHFGTKERLYAEVLSRMGEGLSGVVSHARGAGDTPAARLEALLLRLSRNAFERPDDTQLLMRELLDNKARAERAHSWPLKAFLDQVVGLMRAAVPALTEAEALGRVYLLMGAFNYVAVSQPTLTQMFGESAVGSVMARLPEDLRRLIQASLAP